jgi:NADP-dependent 3-hydroxy acid dehydrogenase YdfG
MRREDAAIEQIDSFAEAVAFAMNQPDQVQVNVLKSYLR